MDMGTCCAYFCTGISFFGIITLAAVSAVLQGGGAHYISEGFAARHGEPPEHSAADALQACIVAMGIYAAFFIFCGIRVYMMNSKAASKQLLDEE